jgi:hypothetical protein
MAKIEVMLCSARWVALIVHNDMRFSSGSSFLFFGSTRVCRTVSIGANLHGEFIQTKRGTHDANNLSQSFPCCLTASLGCGAMWLAIVTMRSFDYSNLQTFYHAPSGWSPASAVRWPADTRYLRPWCIDAGSLFWLLSAWHEIKRWCHVRHAGNLSLVFTSDMTTWICLPRKSPATAPTGAPGTTSKPPISLDSKCRYRFAAQPQAPAPPPPPPPAPLVVASCLPAPSVPLLSPSLTSPSHLRLAPLEASTIAPYKCQHGPRELRRPAECRWSGPPGRRRRRDGPEFYIARPAGGTLPQCLFLSISRLATMDFELVLGVKCPWFPGFGDLWGLNCSPNTPPSGFLLLKMFWLSVWRQPQGACQSRLASLV